MYPTQYPLVHRGIAPAAIHNYRYVQVVEGRVVEQESGLRDPFPGNASQLEFYNRTWNTWHITPIPQVLDPLPVIDRLESNFHRDGHIPTIHLAANPTELDQIHRNIFDDIKITANMTYISLDGIQIFDAVQMELAGRGSRWQPKLSYNLKLPKNSPLYGQKRLKLRAMGMDPSYIREYLAFKTVASVGLATSGASFVRVFINGSPVGLFCLVENFKNPWIRNEFGGGDEHYGQGILYQGDFTSSQSYAVNHFADLSYYKENETAYGDGQYKIKTEPSAGNASYRPLMELTEFINQGSLNPEEWEQHFDMESVIRSFVMDILLGNSDCYMTLRNNYYLYQNGVDAQQFVYIPTDYDTTFGNGFVKISDMLSGDYTKFPGLDARPLSTKLLRVPKFNKRFKTLLRYLAENLVNLDVLGRTIDDTVSWLAEDVAWDKQQPRLGRFDFGHLNNSDIEKSGVVFDTWPYPVDNATGEEFYHNFTERNKISVETAIDGPTGFISIMGVKEFIATQSRAVAGYFFFND
ncbi:coth protein-domain-containing protein [Fennellomyces sp. T-0311]|nr:coth protein-domain-containing protein [Fennellomyces sp. T-0311]